MDIPHTRNYAAEVPSVDAVNAKEEAVEKSPLFRKIDESLMNKVALFKSSYARYAARAMLATLFLTLGTAAAFGTALQAEKFLPGSGKFTFAFMFSWSLVMIIFMGAELGTSNMLFVTVGVYRKKIHFSTAAKVLGTTLLFNLIGGIFFAYLISLTGPFQDLPSANYLFDGIAAKLSKSSIQIFVEAIFANIIVNTAFFINLRMKDDAGKVMAIIFVIFIFALIGNYVGGALVIGMTYAWMNKTKTNYVD